MHLEIKNHFSNDNKPHSITLNWDSVVDFSTTGVSEFAYLFFGKIKLKMLAIFNKELVQPPQELNSPALSSAKKPRLANDILNDFMASHPNKAFSIGFGNTASLAYVPPPNSNSTYQRYNFFFTY